jgi:hypothetical protein
MENENYQGLSKIGAKEEELTFVADKIQDYVRNENDDTLQVIADKMKARPGLIGLFFPGKIQREYDKLSIERMREVFKSRAEALTLYTKTLIELAKKQGDMMIAMKVHQYEGELAAQAMQIRTSLTSFAQAQINIMSDSFEKSRISFGERRARQLRDAEKYREDEFYYTRFMRSINAEADTFFDTIKNLLAGFTNALNTKLEQS